MKKTHPELGRAFVFTGLTAALALGIIGSCCYHRHPGAVTTSNPRQISRIAMLDAQAKPHFDEARRNIPSIVEQMTEIGTTCNLCWLMARDKLVGTSKTQEYLNSILEKPIIELCRKGAKVYGCDFNSTGFLNALKSINADYAEVEAYAVSGLAIESLFLKQTIAALTSTFGGIVARLSATFGSGAACAAADGPFPFGDAVAVVLVAGGTAWSGYDLYEARKHLPVELTAMLKQAIRDCQAACRGEAIK